MNLPTLQLVPVQPGIHKHSYVSDIVFGTQVASFAQGALLQAVSSKGAEKLQ